MVLKQLDSHMEKNEFETLFHSMCEKSTQNGAQTYIKELKQ